MRWVFGSAGVTSGGSAVRISTDSYGRIVAFAFTYHAFNALPMYLGSDSTVSSANGHSISSTGRFPDDGMFTVPVGKGLAPSTFWVNASADTTDKLDYSFLVEP